MYVFTLLGAMLDDVSVMPDQFEWFKDDNTLSCFTEFGDDAVDAAVRSICDVDYNSLEIRFKDGKISTIVCDETPYNVADDIEKFISDNGQTQMYEMMCREVVKLGTIYA